MKDIALLLGPQPPRLTVQLYPASHSLFNLYLGRLSQCTLINTELLDTLQAWVQAAQQTKAKVQHRHNQAKFNGYLPNSMAACLYLLQRKSKHQQQTCDDYTQYLLGAIANIEQS